MEGWGLAQRWSSCLAHWRPRTQLITSGSEKGAQQSRALAALAEDKGSFPTPTGQLGTISNTSSRGSDMLFLSLRAQGTHIVYTEICVGKTLKRIR